jgi:putative transposase
LKDLDWTVIRLLIFIRFVYNPSHHYLIAADETVEGKAGKATHGIGLFYSSTNRRVINSVSFLNLSLVDTVTEKSSMIGCQQIVKANHSQEDKIVSKKGKDKPSVVKPVGRPKGSKNKPKTPPLGISYTTLDALLKLTLGLFAIHLPNLSCFHIVLDGFYGHEDYVNLAIEKKLNIISKFKRNAHLIFQYQGLQKPNGRPRILGQKVKLDKIDPQYFTRNIYDEQQNVKTEVYQFKAYTPKIAGVLLNIVVLVHKNQTSKKESRTILFSNDLALTDEQIVKYYSLRFQIEFEFRDAKQFFGLADFKNVKPTQVTNAVNIAFTMNLISRVLLEKYKIQFNAPKMGILDLKTIFKAQKYIKSTLISNNINNDEFLSSPQFLKIARLETIHI